MYAEQRCNSVRVCCMFVCSWWDFARTSESLQSKIRIIAISLGYSLKAVSHLHYQLIVCTNKNRDRRDRKKNRDRVILVTLTDCINPIQNQIKIICVCSVHYTTTPIIQKMTMVGTYWIEELKEPKYTANWGYVYVYVRFVFPTQQKKTK